MVTKILKYAFAIFLILVLIVLLRAYLHQPDAYQAQISEPIIFDESHINFMATTLLLHVQNQEQTMLICVGSLAGCTKKLMS